MLKNDEKKLLENGIFFEFSLKNKVTSSVPVAHVKKIENSMLPSFQEFLKVTLNK